MQKTAIVFILLLFVGVFSYSQEPSKVKGSQKVDNPLSVQKISFKGLSKVPEDMLRSIVQTRIGQEIDPDRLSKDIKNLYKDTGLFSDIMVDVETAEDGGLNVIFNVKESPKIEGQINIIGNEKIKFGKIKEAITLKPGEIYNQRLSWRSEQSILQLYKEKGYYLASVKAYTDLNPEANIVSVTFEVNEGERIKIQEINLYGNEGVSSEKLRKKIKTRVGKRFDEAIFEEDLTRLLTFYQDNGYAQSKLVKHEKRFTEDKIGIIVEIEIDEGPQYIINEYDMKVSYSEKPAFKQEKIQEMINPAEGEIFDRGEFEKSILEIKQLYSEEGYVLMTLNPIPSYNEQEGYVDFLIEIDEGSVIVIDQVKINGLIKTKEKVVRRELDQLKIKTGEFLDMKALRKARQRLFQMGFLRNVEFIPSNTEGQKRNLNVNLDESPRTGMFSLGGGYGSEGGLFGIAEVGENNLMGQAYNIHLKGEVGTWYRRTAELRLGTPWVLGSPTRANIRIYNNTFTRRYYRGLTSYSSGLTDISYRHVRYIDKRKGVSLTLGRPIFEDIDASIRFRNEDANVKHRKTTQGGGIELENYLDRFTRSLTLMLSRDTRDYRTSLYHPISGAYGTISYEYSGGFLGADNNFRKYSLDFSWFLKTWQNFVFASHLNGGILDSRTSTKSSGSYYDSYRIDPLYFERFWIGGIDTVRGYEDFEIVPTDGPRGYNPNGGNKQIYANFEYRVPVSPQLTGVLFFDVGNVWQQSLSNISRKDLDFKKGVGVGIRFDLGGGMLVRLEYGFPLDRDLWVSDRSGKFHFSVGPGF